MSSVGGWGGGWGGGDWEAVDYQGGPMTLYCTEGSRSRSQGIHYADKQEPAIVTSPPEPYILFYADPWLGQVAELEQCNLAWSCCAFVRAAVVCTARGLN